MGMKATNHLNKRVGLVTNKGSYTLSYSPNPYTININYSPQKHGIY